MTVLRLLICILWCQRLLRQNEYCCYKLVFRVKKKKGKHFCSILRQEIVVRFRPVRFAFGMNCASSIGILEHYLEMVFQHGLLYFCHVSAMSVCSHPSHQCCTLGEITRRIEKIFPIMRVIFCYFNSKWIVFFLFERLINSKSVLQKGVTFISLYWTTIIYRHDASTTVKHADSFIIVRYKTIID